MQRSGYILKYLHVTGPSGERSVKYIASEMVALFSSQELNS